MNYEVGTSESGKVTLPSGDWDWKKVEVVSMPEGVVDMRHYWFTRPDEPRNRMLRRLIRPSGEAASIESFAKSPTYRVVFDPETEVEWTVYPLSKSPEAYLAESRGKSSRVISVEAPGDLGELSDIDLLEQLR